ncbi:hypothetical protein DUF924 [Rhodovulum sp. PH10]|uniref:DUF924 family protein n=1 Tax=Rhodovulum sp. PH10 TaxID=1187851 RepID=UPI00027C29AB|nr:DUF924 family protein [Rhodovulum sp. PH10]EJW13295.1 hypothetical protein DUF924 [Rhodovulum sp. PH10]
MDAHIDARMDAQMDDATRASEAAPSPVSAADVVAFWTSLGPTRWFAKDDAVDAAIKARFAKACEDAAAGRLAAWEETPDGALALLLLLDQFPRNLFRGSRKAFDADPLGRAVADRAIARGHDRAFDNPLRRFFYVPFMHSEDLADQERCVALCQAAGDAEGVHHAEVHAAIIRRFGRFPHRNPLLGRVTTPEEQAFLDAGGFAG